MVTATARGGDGNPVPDGTVVMLSVSGPSGGVVVGEAGVDLAAKPDGSGGWLLRRDGSVLPQGSAATLGDAKGELHGDAAAVVATPTGNGYWIVSAAGDVKAFGDAAYSGDLYAANVGTPIVGLSPDADGGYHLAAADGRAFAFDAPFRGSPAPEAKAVVAIEATPSGLGYWVVSAGGRVSAYGDAKFLGGTAEITLNKLIVDFDHTPSGNGYWFTASDGGIFAFGDARFYGSTGGIQTNAPINAVVAGPDGAGYWLTGGDGAVYTFGSLTRFAGAYGAATTNGTATFRFTSTAPGTSTVTASMAGDAGAPVTSAPVTVTWPSGPPARVVLTPASATTNTASAVRFTARVTDADGYAVADGVAVRFTAGGTGTESPADTSATTSLGNASFDLRATAAGRSTVTATVSGVTPATATVDWTQARPDLRLSLSGAPDPVPAGGEVMATVSVRNDGGIFTFGEAVFLGSTGSMRLNAPVQSLVPDPDGTGYWLVASDGVFTFEAPFRGSLGSVRLNRPITGMVPYGDGYLMVGEDGGIFSFSDKAFLGSLGDHPPARPVVSVAAAR